MAKAKTAYVCAECGGSHNKWQGQCTDCGAWNTLSEVSLAPVSTARGGARHAGWARDGGPKVIALSDVQGGDEKRKSTGNGKLHRVPAGGPVQVQDIGSASWWKTGAPSGSYGAGGAHLK